jgi:hypothetical protein
MLRGLIRGCAGHRQMVAVQSIVIAARCQIREFLSDLQLGDSDLP